MKKAKPEISNLDALKILRAGLNPKRETSNFDWHLLSGDMATKTPPSDGVTVKDVMTKLNMGENAARRILKQKEAQGLLQSGRFSIGPGGAVTFWWAKKGKK